MTEKYTGNDRRYTGDEIEITYNLKRCIHAEYCVKHLPEVYDKHKRPWINANGAPAEQVARVIELCPSGALHYDRKDGVREAVPAKNTITVRHNGPLEIRGDLSILGARVELMQETRATLCRCGASHNKPFCDNSHKDIAFNATERPPIEATVQPAGGKIIITAEKNGPLTLHGAVTIVNEANEVLFVGELVTLCRCGGSANKPLCDGTHDRSGFTAE